jgi:predicted DNA-binding transcriptional regulator AlpA
MSRLHSVVPGDLELQQVASQPNGPDLLTQVAVCDRLGISIDTWWRWRKAGLTPEAVTLPSGRLKWRRSDIDRMSGAVPAPAVDRPGRRRYFKTAALRVVGRG